MSALDLAALRALAERATPGPWKWGEPHEHARYKEMKSGDVTIFDDGSACDEYTAFVRDEDAAYIAAAHPAAVLSLITAAERVPALEAENARLREALEQTHVGLTTTGMLDPDGILEAIRMRVAAALEPKA